MTEKDPRLEITRLDDRAQLIRSAYEANPERAREAAVVKYLCKQHFNRVLLIVWRAPGGFYYYSIDYTLPPAKNLAESTPSARARRTLDGNNHWPASAGILDEFRGVDQMGIPLNCTHPMNPTNVSTTALLMDADRATPGKPFRHLVSS